MKKERFGMLKNSAFTLFWIFISAHALGMRGNLNPDSENCMLCHRYPAMGRYDKTGKKRVFYVNEQEHANSVHGRLKCTKCHVGLDTIPHTDIKKVDCSSMCHLSEPSTDREFSHSNMIEKFEQSVHGKSVNGKEKPYQDDLPTCKYCHNNQSMVNSGLQVDQSDALLNETLTRCTGCHTEKEWAKTFFAHMTHRMKPVRESAEIVELCISCHENSAMMARHGLESVGTYKDTFHWVLLKYGVEDAPDCIDCHVSLGYTTHDIRPGNDPISPIRPENRVQTCSNQGGVKSCHPDATSSFAKGRVHHFGVKDQLILAQKHMGDTDQVQESAINSATDGQDVRNDEHFQIQFLVWLKLFYKILIAVVIGLMSIHQLLDFIRAKINCRKAFRFNSEGTDHV